jgi:hypothetical protein
MQILSPRIQALVSRLLSLQAQVSSTTRPDAPLLVDWRQFDAAEVLEIPVNEAELCLEAGLFESSEEPCCNPNAISLSANAVIAATGMIILSLFYEGGQLDTLKENVARDGWTGGKHGIGNETMYSALIDIVAGAEEAKSEQSSARQPQFLNPPLHAFDIIRNSVDREVWNWRHNEVLLTLQDRALVGLGQSSGERGENCTAFPESQILQGALAIDDDDEI